MDVNKISAHAILHNTTRGSDIWHPIFLGIYPVSRAGITFLSSTWWQHIPQEPRIDLSIQMPVSAYLRTVGQFKLYIYNHHRGPQCNTQPSSNVNASQYQYRLVD